MKLFISLFFFIFRILASYGQQPTGQHEPIMGLGVFILGDSIQKFKNLLSCASQESKELIKLEGQLSCKAFRFLPAEKDSVQVGNVKFPNTFLEIDDQKRIAFVDFIKNYFASAFTKPKKQVQDDYINIIIYMDSLLNVKSKHYKYEHSESELWSQDGRVWKNDNVTYTLIKTKIKKTPKLPYSLDFSYTIRK